MSDTTAATWRKPAVSGDTGDCVSYADLGDGMVGIRDSKEADGPVLRFRRSEIRALLDAVRQGELDDLAQ